MPPASTPPAPCCTTQRPPHRHVACRGIPQTFEARGGVAYRKQLWSSDNVAHDYTWQKFFFTSDLQEAKRQVMVRDPKAQVAILGRLGGGEQVAISATYCSK